jgi:hypothetical protein
MLVVLWWTAANVTRFDFAPLPRRLLDSQGHYMWRADHAAVAHQLLAVVRMLSIMASAARGWFHYET